MMKVRETTNAFAGNPIIGGKRDKEGLESLFGSPEAHRAKVLPLCEGKPLVVGSQALWRLAWQPIDDIGGHVPYKFSSNEERNEHLVYVGEKDGVAYFAIDVPVKAGGDRQELKSLARSFSEEEVTFFDLRTLMQAADWGSPESMGELSIAGHARAMLEWHKQASYCGRCGSSSFPILCGQRRQCSNSKCSNKLYPRIDPVVIMLVIDKERDCAILGRQSRFVPRMWSCLAGFIEPGESLEEAVRRETREEVGIEISDLIYHSSQPWPVGPSSMSCQLMIGFFAYAKTFNIQVDRKELEDAQWYSREQVRSALQHNQYRKDQEEAALKVQKAALSDGGARLNKSLTDAKKETTEVSTPAFVPGPYAIAHHLISTWANHGGVLGQQSSI